MRRMEGIKGIYVWRKSLRRISLLLILLVAMTTATTATDKAAMGKVTGQVFDDETGEPLIGATVQVKGTQIGALTDLDGFFRIKKIPLGSVNLIISSIGYTRIEIENLEVDSDSTVPLNVRLKPEAHVIDGIKIQATYVQNTEASMLRIRKEATAISDAISSQQISRSGSGNAAEAMTKVTGASVVDGKFVFVRGLGDRYANTQLNGSALPSPNPDQQAVPMDLLPANLLDNIVVEKTFTPDKPGDFAGGSINLGTKDYPERRTLAFSTSSGFNSITTLRGGVLTQTGGGKDWLGYDDGHRDIPGYIEDNSDFQSSMVEGITFLNATGNSLDSVTEKANYMDSSSKSFSSEMTPSTRKPPINQSHSISYEDNLQLFERPLGIVASLSYSRKYSSYTDGFSGKYENQGGSDLSVEHELQDQKGVEDVLWGTLAHLTYGIHNNHKFGLNFVHTQNGESVSRSLEGANPQYLDPGDIFRTRVLWYSQRKLTSLQINGKHANLLAPWISADWQFSVAATEQFEPDVRFFSDELSKHYVEDEETGDLVWDGTWISQIQTSRYPAPQRAWRDLNERNRNFRLNFTLPFNRSTKIRTGFAYLKTDREQTDRRYNYTNTDDYAKFNGDIEGYFNSVGLDRIDTLTQFPYTDTVYQFRFKNYLTENVEDRNQYVGESKIMAFYGMANLRLTDRIKLVMGARLESTNMTVTSHDSSIAPGNIDVNDILPSLNIIYSAKDDMNIRLTYGRTLARPTLREMSPATMESFGASRILLGNPEIRHILINNYDVRWEWFIRPGEVLAVSGFYKKFKDPIEMTIFGANGDLKPQNVDEGSVLGLELEFRHRLDDVHSKLANFTIGGNFTVVQSEVTIPEDEMLYILSYDPSAKNTRPMTGQSPFLINLDLGYDNPGTGTQVSLFYNVFGERFAFNATNGTPDVYEQPRNQLDLLVSQKVIFGAKLKFSAKNLLGEDIEFLYDKLNPDSDIERRVYKSHSLGRTYSLGLSYQIW